MGLGALLLSRTTGWLGGNAEAVVATPFRAPVFRIHPPNVQ
jgi:hypothetical protein